MATKLFLTRAASSSSDDLTGNHYLLGLTAGDGSGLQTGTANTITSTIATVQMTETAGGTAILWVSNPLNAVTIATLSGTGNAWMSESNMSANVQAWIEWGTITAGISTGASARNSGVELPVTTRAAQNFSIADNVGSHSVALGDRLYVIVYGFPVGTEASGFTFNLGYNGTTGAADGDSWVSFTETITEQAVAGRVPYVPPQMPSLLAQ